MGMDYKELFKHVEGLKKVLLVAIARAGSDFFQSLLDGHPEILQVTGVLFFHPWWKQARCKENLAALVDEFIGYSSSFSNHIEKFKSYYNKRERWDQLGPQKNEFFEVDIDVFKEHVLNAMADRELNRRNFFLAVNLAYGLATAVDIDRTKILFFHAHHIDRLKDFKEDFPDFDVICSTREPRNVLVSAMEHWKNYDSATYNPNFLYHLLKRILEESEPISQHTTRFKTLKLEDLHLLSKEALDEFCAMYNLEFNDSMLESSYHGKKWWGDALSGRYLDGFNKNIKTENWREKLFSYDNFLIEFILEERLRHYRYSLHNRMSKISAVLACLLVFLPMRYELKVLMHSLGISGQEGSRGKIFYLCRSIFFYALRIILYLKFINKKISKRIFLPDYFTQRNMKDKRDSLSNSRLGQKEEPIIVYEETISG